MDVNDRTAAPFFDQLARDGFMAEFDEEDEAKVRRFLTEWAIGPGERIFEPGCGTGRLTAILAKAVGADGEVYATDIAPEMLARARKRTFAGRVVVALESVLTIGRPDGYFSQVICLNAFPHFPHPEKALGELHRVLAPRGRLSISHLFSRQEVNRIHTEEGPPLCHHLLPEPEDLRKMLEKNGFEVERIEDTDECFCMTARKKTRPE